MFGFAQSANVLCKEMQQKSLEMKKVSATTNRCKQKQNFNWNTFLNFNFLRGGIVNWVSSNSAM